MPAGKRAPEIIGRPSKTRRKRPGRGGTDPLREGGHVFDPSVGQTAGVLAEENGGLADHPDSHVNGPLPFASLPVSPLLRPSLLALLFPFLNAPGSPSLARHIPGRSKPNAAWTVACSQKAPRAS
jgi:hypothetical protein